MSRANLAAVVVFSCLTVFGAGCGHDHHESYYVTSSSTSTSAPFTLTLQNNTNQTLLPGPITAEPFVPNLYAPSIPPGGQVQVSISFLPSSITVGAEGVGAFANYVYPTTTLYRGVDYLDDATGVTFVYH
jgi:hypothetical protein